METRNLALLLYNNIYKNLFNDTIKIQQIILDKTRSIRANIITKTIYLIIWLSMELYDNKGFYLVVFIVVMDKVNADLYIHADVLKCQNLSHVCLTSSNPFNLFLEYKRSHSIYL